MIDTENYFDAIVSVDAYHYFGCKEGVFVYKEEIKTALYMALTCLRRKGLSGIPHGRLT